jgi:hypothetical protein
LFFIPFHSFFYLFSISSNASSITYRMNLLCSAFYLSIQNSFIKIRFYCFFFYLWFLNYAIVWNQVSLSLNWYGGVGSFYHYSRFIFFIKFYKHKFWLQIHAFLIEINLSFKLVLHFFLGSWFRNHCYMKGREYIYKNSGFEGITCLRCRFLVGVGSIGHSVRNQFSNQ